MTLSLSHMTLADLHDFLMKLDKTGHSVRARGKIRATLHEMEEKSGDDVIM